MAAVDPKRSFVTETLSTHLKTLPENRNGFFAFAYQWKGAGSPLLSWPFAAAARRIETIRW